MIVDLIIDLDLEQFAKPDVAAIDARIAEVVGRTPTRFLSEELDRRFVWESLDLDEAFRMLRAAFAYGETDQVELCAWMHNDLDHELLGAAEDEEDCECP